MLRYIIIIALVGVIIFLTIEFSTISYVELPPTTSASTNESLSPQIQSTGVITPVLSKIEGDIKLGKTINMQIDNLSSYIAQTQKKPWTLVPYLNGRALNKLYPSTIDLQHDVVSFYLEPTTDSKDVWLPVLRPRFNTDFQQVPIQLSVGFEDEAPFATSHNQELYLTIFPTWRLLLFLCLLVLFLAIVASLARRMLLDSNKVTFSLARTLFIYWLSIITISFGFIYLVTWDYNTLTGSVTMLLGISASTTLGAALIDAGKPNLKQVSKDITTLKSNIDDLSEVDSVTKDIIDSIEQRISEIQRNVGDILKDMRTARRNKNTEFTWEKFFSDTLYDGDNISLQRFQIFVWSIVLGVIFVASVVTNLTMPEFNETLLLLLGISSGTYLGLKIQEPPKPGSEREEITPV